MFAGGYRGREVFETQYAVYSMAMSGREGLEEGDKILMPMSAFEKLSRMEVDYPMLFELNNEQLGKKTHCGVLEFTAEEGRIYLPFWMMQNLFVEQGTLVKLKNITLKKANFVKFRAQSVDFLDITDHRAVMEVSLRRYTCLTQGDMITMPYSGKNYELEVVEVKPDGKACIVETDVKIDFDEPVGYVQPNVRSRAESLADSDAAGGTEGGANGNASQRKAQCARSDSTLEEEAKAAVRDCQGIDI